MTHSGSAEVVQQEVRPSLRRQENRDVPLRNVLIVDDDNSLLYIFQKAFGLYARDYNLLTAKNGDEAVKLLGKTPVEVLLTDLDMPVMNGYELISYVVKKHPRIKVLVMSGCREPVTEKNLQRLGISRFIKKPFSICEVLDQIFSIFGQGSSVSSLETQRSAEGRSV